MMPEDHETSIQAVKRWAREEIDRLIYAGTRPISICPTVEAATREAAIAHGNAITHLAEIAEIESVSTYVSECLEADIHCEGRGATNSS
ncbi:MAG: hypothetical protein WAK16_13860 [Candidatus Cybelea sp.]